MTFVAKSVRRYWWVVVANVVVGLLPLAFGNADPDQYVSRAVLLVSPPSEAPTQVTFNNDPDRYVIGQLAVLRSSSLAEAVAAALGTETGASVANAIEVEHLPETDVVDVIATAYDPAQAQRLANAYVDVYFEGIVDEVEDAQRPEIEQLDQRLAVIGQELEQVDQAITTVMAPYLQESRGVTGAAIPTVDQLAPSLVSRKSTLFTQYGEILTLKTQLEVSSRLRVTSRIVQRGALPVTPEPQSDKLAFAWALGMLVLGLAGAVLLARLSPDVLDDDHAAAILRRPVVAAPRSGVIRRSGTAALDRLPSKLIPFVDGLCVRAEAAGRAGAPLRILVTGSRPVAGTSVLAMAVASRFAASGARVLLVDANPLNPEITRAFAPDAPGLAALADGRAAGRELSPRLAVVGLSHPIDVSELHRRRVGDLIGYATERADVVVIDAGAMQSSVSTAQMMRLVDVAVLAVPNERQPVDELEAVAGQLDLFETEVVAVTTPARTTRRRARGPLPSGEKQARDGDGTSSIPRDPSDSRAKSHLAPPTVEHGAASAVHGTTSGSGVQRS